MTISSNLRKAGPYAGNAATTAFPFAYKVFATSDVVVTKSDGITETTLALTTDYTVALNADQNANPGGTVTYPASGSPLPVGQTLTLSSSVPELQPTSITNQGGFYPKIIEDALDRLTIFVQQIKEQLNRSLKLPISVTGVSTQLPIPIGSQVIAWKPDGSGLQNVGPVDNTLLAVQLADNADLTKGATLIGYLGGTLRTYLNQFPNTTDPAKGAALIGFKQFGLAIPGGPAVVKKGFWADISPGANIWRFRDRVLIGDAVDQDGNKTPTIKTWVGQSALGFMTYFDSRSQSATYSAIGELAAAFASRSSDNTELGGLNTIGVGSYAKNDNTNAADKKSAWCYYGHAVQEVDNNFTACMEVDIANRATLVKVNPFLMGAIGTTAAHWIGVGGETAQSGQSVNPASVAIAIIANGTRNAIAGTGALFDKGIVFQADALSGCDGVNGSATAMQLAKGHMLEWLYSGGANAVGARIRSDVNDATKQTRIVFKNGGFSVVGTQADLTTENNLFQVPPNQTAVNYIAAVASNTGAAVSLNAIGADANIDFGIVSKGTGLLKFSYTVANAAVAANFTAQQMLAIKDVTGSTYYIPCRSGTW